jgi:hypothetical protein
MRRRFFGLTLSPLPFALSFFGALLIAPCWLTAVAQQQVKFPRIGCSLLPAPGPLICSSMREGSGVRDHANFDGCAIFQPHETRWTIKSGV